eukprot:scaffold1854_cov113-Isochrysis_galbana.AAC.12
MTTGLRCYPTLTSTMVRQGREGGGEWVQNRRPSEASGCEQALCAHAVWALAPAAPLRRSARAAGVPRDGRPGTWYGSEPALAPVDCESDGWARKRDGGGQRGGETILAARPHRPAAAARTCTHGVCPWGRGALRRPATGGVQPAARCGRCGALSAVQAHRTLNFDSWPPAARPSGLMIPPAPALRLAPQRPPPPRLSCAASRQPCLRHFAGPRFRPPDTNTSPSHRSGAGTRCQGPRPTADRTPAPRSRRARAQAGSTGRSRP